MRLQTLGDLKLLGAELRRPKLLLLLAYLAAEGPKPRRFLAQLFWPQAANPRNSLAKALSQLGRETPGVVAHDDQTVSLTIGSDIAEVMRELGGGHHLQATKLYVAPFLARYRSVPLGWELEEWLLATRELLAWRIRDAHLTLAEQDLARFRHDAARKHAEAAYAVPAAQDLEPEQLVRLYRLLLRCGSPTAGRLRREAEELDLALDSDNFAAAIPARQQRFRFPSRGTSFVGREQELATLADTFRDGPCRLLTLIGQGGAGKTRLALEYAQRARDLGLYRDGVAFVALETLDDAGAIPVRIAETLGLTLQGADVPAELVRQLRHSRALLVLDNFEQLLEGADFLVTLLDSCPELKVLVTSRERLWLDSEWIVEVKGLPFSGSSDLEAGRSEGFDAVELFVERASQVRQGFRLGHDEEAAVLDICRLVDGLPLALELAAGWVRTMTPGAIAEEIRSNLDILSTRARNVPDRQRSIRATFEPSWRLLDPEARAVLVGLSVFVGGFAADAAREVTGATLPALAALIDRSLLQADTNGRYDLHPLLLQFVREPGRYDPQHREAARRNHAHHYQALLATWGGRLNEAPLEVLTAFDLDRANVLAAWHWSVEQSDLGRAFDTAQRLMEFFFRRGSGREAIDQFGRAVAILDRAALEPAAALLLGHLFLYQAVFRYYLGQPASTVRLVERSLALLRPLGENRAIVRNLNLLGGVATLEGDYRQAGEHYREALALAEAVGEAPVSYLNNLGHVAIARGAYREAHDYYRRALEASRDGRNEATQASPLANLGRALLLLGELEAAQQHFERSLDIVERHGFEGQRPYTLLGLARLALRRGHHAEGKARCLEAREHAEAQDDILLEGPILLELGRLELAAGEITAAEDHLRESLALAQATSDVPGTLAALEGLAAALLARQEWAAASRLAATVAAHPAARHATRTAAEVTAEAATAEVGVPEPQSLAEAVASQLPSVP